MSARPVAGAASPHAAALPPPPPPAAAAAPRAARAATRRPSAARLVGLALAALALLAAWPALPAQAGGAALQAHRPGEELLLDGCLRLSALGFTDRNGPLESADWVTLRLSNGCAEPVRHVLVELLLQDVLGTVYGARLWLLDQGEVLQPGQSKTDRYAVSDAADHVPARWGARLRAAERPSDRIRRPPAAGTAGRTAPSAAAASGAPSAVRP